MRPTNTLRRFGILIALLTLSATFLGGFTTAYAQEPATTGTPPPDAPVGEVTTLTPEDCSFVTTNEALPTTVEPATSDGGTSVTIEITVNIDSNGAVSVDSGGEDTTIPAETAANATGATKITESTVDDLALVEAGCTSSAIDYPDASPTDPNTEGTFEATPTTEQPDTDCTIIKETKLADGTTEKTLSCPAQ